MFIERRDLKPPYFFGLSGLIQPGAILEPGNWGRILDHKKDWTPQDRAKWDAETRYDQVRLETDATAPSRLKSLFICPTLEDANAFLQGTKRSYDVLYEVEPIEEQDAVFITDWTAFKFSPRLDHTQEFARTYWKAEPSSNRELLLPIAVRILRRV